MLWPVRVRSDLGEVHGMRPPIQPYMSRIIDHRDEDTVLSTLCWRMEGKSAAREAVDGGKVLYRYIHGMYSSTPTNPHAFHPPRIHTYVHTHLLADSPSFIEYRVRTHIRTEASTSPVLCHIPACPSTIRVPYLGTSSRQHKYSYPSSKNPHPQHASPIHSVLE